MAAPAAGAAGAQQPAGWPGSRNRQIEAMKADVAQMMAEATEFMRSSTPGAVAPTPRDAIRAELQALVASVTTKTLPPAESPPPRPAAEPVGAGAAPAGALGRGTVPSPSEAAAMAISNAASVASASSASAAAATAPGLGRAAAAAAPPAAVPATAAAAAAPAAAGRPAGPPPRSRSRSIQKIKILRSPTPRRNAPPSRRSSPRDRSRSQAARRRRSRSRTPPRRRERSPSRGRRRPTSSRSHSRRMKRRRGSSSSSESARTGRNRRSPVPAKPSVFTSAETLSVVKADTAAGQSKGFSGTPPPGAADASEASAEAIRLAQLKAASSLRQNAPPPPANMRPDDWFCPVCTTHNYASRTRCFRCNQGVNPGRGGGLANRSLGRV